MHISIGMPVHNAVDHTLRAIDRVIWACQANCYLFDLNVIDDNSTREVNQRLLERLRLERSAKLMTTQALTENPAPNLGFNVNRLLDEVKPEADYYLNLETDVFINPGTLKRLIERMEQNDGLCATFPKQLTADQQQFDFHFCQGGYPALDKLPEKWEQDCFFPWTHFGCLLVRGSDARNKDIRVDERFKLFCSDQDYTLRLRQMTGRNILYVASAHVMHVGHASSLEGEAPNPQPDCFKLINAKWDDFMGLNHI